MRKMVLLGLMLALLLAPGMVQAGMWVGLQGGATFAATEKMTNSGDQEEYRSIKWDVAPLGGIIIGYDFVKEGFLGYNYPDWMKYFSFCTDFTYNTMQARHQMQDSFFRGHFDEREFFGPAEVTLACWSFLFKARYGFFPDSEVPFGRLQPYIMVGPGILFSTIRGNIEDAGEHMSGDSVDVCLVTEAGIRWMALKNVSLDAGFRYRFAKPGWKGLSGEGNQTTIKTDLNLFTAMFRVSYHF